MHKRALFVTTILKPLSLSQMADGDICPSSVAKYFHDLGFAVEEQFPDVYKSIASEVAMPRLDKKQADDVEELEPEELLEWIGCQSLGIRL